MDRTATRLIGEAEVTVLTDGTFEFTEDLFPGTTSEHLHDVLARRNANNIATNFNAILIRNGGKTTLCDAGPRDLFGPTCGFLSEALKSSGTAPEDIEILVATHMHPDHIAGMITTNGKAAFPNAELIVTEGEYAFWSDESNTNGPDPLPDWGALARAVLAAYAGQTRVVPASAEVAPGLSLMPLLGHTPGHAGWRLASGDAQLIHVGDIIHAPALQAADPNIAIAFDMDMDTARETRKRLLDELATDGALFTGGHFLHPAFHKAVRDGAGYALERP